MRLTANPAEQAEAVHAGHFEIEQDEIGKGVFALVGVFAIFHGLAHGYELAGSANAWATLTGMLMLDALTSDSIEATSSGTDASGLPLPVRTLTFTPRVAYPYGEKCGRFITAGLVLDADGLRQAD